MKLSASSSTNMCGVGSRATLIRALSFFAPVISSPCVFKRVTTTGSLDSVCTVNKGPVAIVGVMNFPVDGLSGGVLTSVLTNTSSGIERSNTILIKKRSVSSRRPGFNLSIAKAMRPRRIEAGTKTGPNSGLVLAGPVNINVLARTVGESVLSRRKVSHMVRIVTTLGGSTTRTVSGCRIGTYASVANFNLLNRTVRVTRKDNANVAVRDGTIPVLPGAERLTRRGVVPKNSGGGRG